jgi:hypothetical protein
MQPDSREANYLSVIPLAGHRKERGHRWLIRITRVGKLRVDPLWMFLTDAHEEYANLTATQLYELNSVR